MQTYFYLTIYGKNYQLLIINFIKTKDNNNNFFNFHGFIDYRIFHICLIRCDYIKHILIYMNKIHTLYIRIIDFIICIKKRKK